MLRIPKLHKATNSSQNLVCGYLHHCAKEVSELFMPGEAVSTFYAKVLNGSENGGVEPCQGKECIIYECWLY